MYASLYYIQSFYFNHPIAWNCEYHLQIHDVADVKNITNMCISHILLDSQLSLAWNLSNFPQLCGPIQMNQEQLQVIRQEIDRFWMEVGSMTADEKNIRATGAYPWVYVRQSFVIIYFANSLLTLLFPQRSWEVSMNCAKHVTLHKMKLPVTR